MERERRLVDRVLRLWKELAYGGRFPRRDQIEPSMLGEDWANCLVIAVQSPVQFSHFLAVGTTYPVCAAPTITWRAYTPLTSATGPIGAPLPALRQAPFFKKN